MRAIFRFSLLRFFNGVCWAIERTISSIFQVKNVLTVNMHQTLGHTRIDSNCIVLACWLYETVHSWVYILHVRLVGIDGKCFLHVILQQEPQRESKKKHNVASQESELAITRAEWNYIKYVFCCNKKKSFVFFCRCRCWYISRRPSDMCATAHSLARCNRQTSSRTINYVFQLCECACSTPLEFPKWSFKIAIQRQFCTQTGRK